MFDTTDFMTALGLAIFLEGLIYTLFPDGMKTMMAQVMRMDPRQIRVMGLGAMALGMVFVWSVRG